MDDESLKAVEKFLFLGAMIDADGGCKMDIMHRLTLGRAAMTVQDKIWKDRDLSVDLKTRLVKALVFPFAMYGCESWTMRKEERGMIGSFEMWCWRHMLKVPWVVSRMNESILQQVGTTTSFLNLIEKQKLSYFSHVMRGDGLEKSIMMGMGDGSRGRGRPWTL